MSTGPVQFAFVLGTGRCGSTLVHEVLARHEGVGFISNLDNRFPALDLKGRVNGFMYRRLPDSMSGFATSGTQAGWGVSWDTRDGAAQRRTRLLPRFGPAEALDLIERQISLQVRRPDRDLTEQDAAGVLDSRFRSFFVNRARAQRRPVFLHHFTGWPRARFVQAALGGGRFIHVVRDGRAVASSLVRTPWWRGRHGPERWGFGALPPEYAVEWEGSGRSLVGLAGLQWKLLMDAFERAARHLEPDSWMEVRFEELLTNPRAEIKRMLRFLGLEWTVAFERQFRRTTFKAARRDAFRSEIEPADLAWLEQSLAGHLERHGYARAAVRTDDGP